MKRHGKAIPKSSFKVWQLPVVVVALGLVIRFALGSVPVPDPAYVQHANVYLPSQTKVQPRFPKYNRLDTEEDTPVVEVLPFNLRGEVPGPLLASILKRYYPASTTDHADDLRDTLPPGDNPRMIVILPDRKDAVF